MEDLDISFRKAAESRLRAQTGRIDGLSSEELRKLVNILGERQLDLEVQIEKLGRSEKELTRRLIRYSNLYESAPLGCFTLNKEGLILEVNTAGARLLRSTKRYLSGKLFPGFIADVVSHALFQKHQKELMEGNEVDIPEIRLKRRDDTLIYAQFHSTAIREMGDNSLQFVVAVTDITERKRREEFMRSVFDGMGEGFVVVDPDYKCIAANRAYCKSVGRCIKDVVGKHCYEASHKVQSPCYEFGEVCPVKQTLDTGEPHSVTHTHV
ncbi:MAG TPA: PAS domain S-box protein, partial [Dissulfurispiraceae bacterium]|nr:PAS domain S-box protein [Dissulfurispiraceae bacterium]